MGLFGRKNNNEPLVCALCDRPLDSGPKWFIRRLSSGKELYRCNACFELGGKVKIIDEKAYLYDENDNVINVPKYTPEPLETRVKCDTCGHVFCYTREDLEENQRLAKSALRSSISGLTGALSGYNAASSINTQSANDQLARIVDYSKCPKCNSRNVRKLSEEEFERENAAQSSTMPATPAASTADELKKFKELLDMGVISQEEFDAKKKQLLGL